MTKDTLAVSWARFFNVPMFSARLSTSNAATATNVYPANYLGLVTPDADNYEYVNHRLFQLLESVYNPFLSRTYSRRDSYSKINLFTPEFTSVHANPFVLFFSLDPENIVEMKVVLCAVRDAIKGIVPCTTDLAGLLSLASGNNIMQHGYSDLALPTWNAGPITKLSTSAVTDKQIRASAFATKINFLQQTDYAATVPVPAPAHGTDEANRNLDLILRTPTADGSHLVPATTDYLKFDANRHQYPNVLVLFPGKKDVEQLYLTTLCGLVIESFELDGSAVPLPHPENHIGDTNNEVLSSAIRLDNIMSAVRFKVDTASPVHTVLLPRRRTLAPAQKFASFLHDLARNYLPFSATNTGNSRSPTAATLAGLTPINGVTRTWPIASFYGADTRHHHNDLEEVNGSVIHDPSNFPKHRILLWSPYRYVSFPSRERPLVTAAKYDTIYMLCNLRTVFGSQASIVGTKHFQACLPN